MAPASPKALYPVLPADPRLLDLFCCLHTHSPFPPVTDDEYWNGLNANLGIVRSRATAGQGQTVALGRNVMRQTNGQVGIFIYLS